MATGWKNGGGGVNRVLNKLKVSIENGNYYEAHQMYRTLYFRYTSQKRFDELLELMYDGARRLLQHKQNSSGADLSNLYVEALIKSEAPVTDQNLEKLGSLYQLVLPDGPERATFVSSALKWSTGHLCEYRLGHPKLHQLVAQILWKEKNYSQAWCHYLRSMDGEGCASMLVEYHMLKGYPSEVDLFIAQAVLQLLCLQNKPVATLVFYHYTGQHPSIRKGPPFLLPLLNFLWYLLLTVESGKLTAFTVLCEQYQPSIQRDPTYSEYLDKIGQLFFGLPPPQPKHQGMFGNLLQSLINGLDDDDEDMGSSSGIAGPSERLQVDELD